MNTSELLHRIAKDRIDGMRTVSSYQLKPVVVKVNSATFNLNLNNDIWMLNTIKLPAHIQILEMLSSDNVFTTTVEEYDLMDEFRFQPFSDYLDITTTSDDFKPYRLEFVKIIPHRK